MGWSDFTLQTWFYAPTPMIHTLLNHKHAVALQDIFLRGCTFKISAGAPKWPDTYKLQHYKICCRLCCRSRNQRIFCERKRFHHSTKHIIRNVPPTAYYTSMHGQYDSRWNCKRYNQATVITRNEYTIFLDLWPKNLKILYHCMEMRTRKY